VLIPCAQCGGAHVVDLGGTCATKADPIERVDPRDFLDPTARAVAYLDIDEVDNARAALGQVSLARLRRLGEHYDRLSMICFELASAANHAADDSVDPASFRSGPDGEGIIEHPGAPVARPAPVIEFEVDDLDELGSADTTERNLDELGAYDVQALLRGLDD